MNRRCGSDSCPQSVISKTKSAIYSYGFSALALAPIFLNSAGADVKNLAEFSSLNISFLSIMLIIVWILTGMIGTGERHDNAAMCMLHACGLPGVAISVLGFVL